MTDSGESRLDAGKGRRRRLAALARRVLPAGIVRPAEPESSAQPTFPLRAAAIDVGSNAIRLLGAEFLQPAHYNVIEQIRAPVRLGHAVFQSGKLDSEAVAAAVETLASFRKRIDALHIDRYRAVATSAVRESRNGDEFLERVRAEAGIELEPITGAEEARLVHVAVRHRIDMGRKRWVLADLGGGSVEVSVVDKQHVHWSVSHGMGSVRLLEELEVAGDNPRRFRRRLEEYTATLRMPRADARYAGFVSTGGNIEALAKLANAPTDAKGVATLELKALHGLIETLWGMTYEERIDELDLRADRADVILPAAMVYERLCELAGFDAILVPHVGVKDGVVLDLVEDAAQHTVHLRRQDEVVWGGAFALGRRYRFDQEHARHVTVLTLSLFDQLQGLHGLGEADRRILLAAGLLHDVGTYISYKKHHKHSLYIIEQSELPGLTTAEIRMVANVARYHRKSGPADHHESFMQLTEDERARVTRLSALLRIADALDREHAQRVERVTARVRGKKLELHVEGVGDLLLERWAVQKKADIFEDTFDLTVSVADPLSEDDS